MFACISICYMYCFYDIRAFYYLTYMMAYTAGIITYYQPAKRFISLTNPTICIISSNREYIHPLVGNKLCCSLRYSWAAPYTFSFSSEHRASMDRAKTTARWDEKHLSFVIWGGLYQRFNGISAVYRNSYYLNNNFNCQFNKYWSQTQLLPHFEAELRKTFAFVINKIAHFDKLK